MGDKSPKRKRRFAVDTQDPCPDVESNSVLAIALVTLERIGGASGAPRALCAIDPGALMALEVLREAGERLIRGPAPPVYAALLECPNRANKTHRCTPYCFWRWKAGSEPVANFHASRVPHPKVWHDDADDGVDTQLSYDCNLMLPGAAAAAAAAQHRSSGLLSEIEVTPLFKGSDRKRFIHNERERVRRNDYRLKFEALRKSVPSIESDQGTTDRLILLEAAAHIRALEALARALERDIIALRVRNLRLRFEQAATPDLGLEIGLTLVDAAQAELARLQSSALAVSTAPAQTQAVGLAAATAKVNAKVNAKVKAKAPAAPLPIPMPIPIPVAETVPRAAPVIMPSPPVVMPGNMGAPFNPGGPLSWNPSLQYPLPFAMPMLPPFSSLPFLPFGGSSFPPLMNTPWMMGPPSFMAATLPTQQPAGNAATVRVAPDGLVPHFQQMPPVAVEKLPVDAVGRAVDSAEPRPGSFCA